MNAFTTLYKRLLTLDPSAPPPLFPPARPFFGDTIEVGVDAPSQSGLSLRGGWGESGSEPAVPLPLPPLQDEPLEEGVLTFTASGPNTAGIVTELFLQPLASRNRRTYLERYRHLAFTGFPLGSAESYPVSPGWYACAYRFVNANTGEATAIAELGIVRAE
ncbi:hypothetical protein EON82_03540 [bacterium]|nr:MAG: hypothetical protein EON82_03540 [bacterium]